MTTTTATIAPSTVEAIDGWWRFQHRAHDFPGYQAAIRAGDALVHSSAVGTANIESGEQLTTDHLFRIASHSKMFTATAALQLAEAGVWRLDDRLDSWVREAANTPVASVTLRELLGHQAGIIRDGVTSDYWQGMHEFPDRRGLFASPESLKVLAPNEYFKYSNYGYSLIGAAFEKATGVSYNEYITRNIIQRLALTRTGADWDAARSGEYAAAHTRLVHHGDHRHVLGHVDTRAMAAATGVYSTAEDLTRFGTAHYFGSAELLSDASRRLMQRQESTIETRDGVPGRYGLGMDLIKIGERELVGHSGGYPGHLSRTFIDPKKQLVISVLGNSLDSPVGRLADGAVRIINLAESLEHDESPSVPDETAARFVGRYANLWGVMDVVHLGGRLTALDPSAANGVDGRHPLDVIDDSHIRFRQAPGSHAVGEVVEFVRDDSGQVTELTGAGMSRWPMPKFLDDVRPVMIDKAQ